MDAQRTMQQMLELTLDNVHNSGIPTNSIKTQRRTKKKKRKETTTSS